MNPQKMMVMPPAGHDRAEMTIGGCTYACDLGETLEVPYPVGLDLTRNGWLATCIDGAGTTAERPGQPRPWARFHDTEIDALLISDGTGWRNALTGAVA